MESVELDGFTRDIRESGDGVLTLAIGVPVNVLDKQWTAVFTIMMQPVPLERIDVLETRVADIEEEGCRICQAAGRVPPISEFEVTAVTTSVRES